MKKTTCDYTECVRDSPSRTPTPTWRRWTRTWGDCFPSRFTRNLAILPPARPTREPGSGRACLSTCPEPGSRVRSEEHTSELQSLRHLVCRLLLEKKKKIAP